MPTIYNSDLINQLRDGAKIQQNKDNIPNQITDKVIPTMEVNPNLLRKTTFVANKTATTTGAQTILTSAVDKDTYLTGILFSYAKDATCDAAIGNLICTAVVGNQVINISMLAVLSLTAQYDSVYCSFPPLLIDKNTGVQIGANSYTVGNMSRTAVVFGYTVDNNRA